MVWPFTSASAPKASSDLDPQLQEFLRKERPGARIREATAGDSAPAIAQASTQPSASPPQDYDTPRTPSGQNKAEKSLFPDGRYAHLWKTYVSPEDMEKAPKTDQEKIDGLIEGYKHRKAEVGRAALENCALESWKINDCFKNGPWSEIAMMCRTHTQRLDRCYTMQMRFLKALGYMSMFERSQEADEAIQMHADTLYQQMIAREEAMETARAAGEPIPKFSLSLPNDAKSSLPKLDNTLSKLSPKTQKAYKKRLQGLEGDERDLEARAIHAEIHAAQELKTNLRAVWSQQNQDMREREAKGQVGILDRIWKLLRAS